jgi:hypothetical protein
MTPDRPLPTVDGATCTARIRERHLVTVATNVPRPNEGMEDPTGDRAW